VSKYHLKSTIMGILLGILVTINILLIYNVMNDRVATRTIRVQENEMVGRRILPRVIVDNKNFKMELGINVQYQLIVGVLDGCPHCISLVKKLDLIQEDIGIKITLLGVGTEIGLTNEMAPYLDDEVELIIVNPETMDGIGVKAYPTTIMVDSDGKVVWTRRGDNPIETADDLKNVIMEHMG
jgi:hypothetical protein